MRVLISLCAFVLVFLVGVKTEWVSVSQASLATSDTFAQEDRTYEAVVLGKTRADATGGELIDAAVARGEISSEQGLLYGVYLACGDPRLPQRFHGNTSRAPARNILWEADVDWASLSPGIQQALHAFFSAGPVAWSALACEDDLERLMGDSSVWWAPAVQEQQPPARLATIE